MEFKLSEYDQLKQIHNGTSKETTCLTLLYNNFFVFCQTYD